MESFSGKTASEAGTTPRSSPPITNTSVTATARGPAVLRTLLQSPLMIKGGRSKGGALQMTRAAQHLARPSCPATLEVP